MSAFVRWLVNEGYVSSGEREVIMRELSANDVSLLYCKFEGLE